MPIISGTLATLEFSLYYDIQKNTLTVHLLQAYNLPVKSSSTCVVLYLLPNKLEVFESQVVHENSNPAYQQMFQFSNLSGSELLRRQTLMFRIFQYSKSVSYYTICYVHVYIIVHVIVVPWISRVYWICTTEGSSMYSPREYIQLPEVVQ